MPDISFISITERMIPMGITEKEAEKRLKEEGENVLSENRRNGAAKIFLGQFGRFLFSSLSFIYNLLISYLTMYLLYYILLKMSSFTSCIKHCFYYVFHSF